jgi:hypothetical protein
MKLIRVFDPQFSAPDANAEPATFGVSSATGIGPSFTQQFVTGVGSLKILDSPPADNYVFGPVVALKVPQPDTFYAYLLKNNIPITDYAIRYSYTPLWETRGDDNALHNPKLINILNDINFNINNNNYISQLSPTVRINHEDVVGKYRLYQSYLVSFAELNPPPQPRIFSWDDQFPEPLPE